MLIKIIIQFIGQVANIILNIIYSNVPNADITGKITELIQGLNLILSQANNFAHFVLGEHIEIILELLIPLISFKYVMYPIISFVRSIFVNGNN